MTHETRMDANLAFALGCGALRYGLGRRSYAVSVIADAIRDRLPLFNVADLVRMRRDIEDALAGKSPHGDAGDGCDQATWQGVLMAIHAEEGMRE